MGSRGHGRSRGLLRPGLVVAGAVLALSGCSSQVAKALEAPIKVLSAADVVVETNEQAALQAAQIGLETAGSFSNFGPSSASTGLDLTLGPSSGPGQLSYAVVGGGNAVLLAGWNHADEHCIGVLYVHSALSSPVLGVTSPGQWDFVAPAKTSSSCDAANLAATSGAPSGWPYGPASGWPKP